MALNWRTYNALPRLSSYAAALTHFNEVVPIRGDVDGTKPAGRRDQKWLAIYKRETDNAVCIGTAWNKDKPLLAYYPDGRVAIESHIGAACRERIQRIAGLNIQRKYNEDWVVAKAYVDGEAVVGHYPLQLRYNNPRTAMFILGDTDNKKPATYLNPVPVYKHTINRQEKAKLTAQYQPFMSYMEVMSKLSATEIDLNPWSKESRDNPRLPMLDHDGRKALGLPVHSLRWSLEGPPEFISLVESGDTESWYKAMVWLSAGHWRKLLSEARLDVTHMMYGQYRDTLFTKERVGAGKLVYDRYGQYFR
jgi:hypothetical protein